MPLFTPSRIAIAVLGFSLISFLWTFGLPHQLAQPALPVVDHGALEGGSRLWHATAPSPQAPAAQPSQEEGHGRDDATQTLPSAPVATGIAGHGDDGERWADKAEAENKSSNTAPSAAANGTAAPVTGLCQDVHNAPHVMVVLKTSKAELHKLPAHILGLLSCVPNFAIFSDHAGDVDGHRVHDALASVSDDARRDHDEFREYHAILADADYAPDAKKTKGLDKWKMLPMVYHAYQMNPHAKFYAFIEADTSLSWTNLLQWVSRLDYRIPYYSGAPSFMNKVQFAQRGPGILLSQGALRRYAKSYEERYASEWESRIAKECCGDIVLATALNDAHVEFYTSWPLLQGEQPNTLDYSKRHWCAPVVSWHHVNSQQLDGIWNSQKEWTKTHGWQVPYLFKNAFKEFMEPHIMGKKDVWDNLSSDAKIVAPKGRQQKLKEDEERQKLKEDEERQKLKEVEEEQQKVKEDALQKEQPIPPSAPPTDLPTKRDEKRDETRDDKRDDKKDNNNDNKKSDKPNWDKIAETFKDAADSPRHCQKACEDVEDCLQWRYTHVGDGVCYLGKVLKLGTKVVNEVEQWTSGWMIDRIKKVTKEWECKEVAWRFYQ